MTTEIVATFADERRAEAARRQLLAAGLSTDAVAVQTPAQVTAKEAGYMVRVVVIIAVWSVVGAAAGAAVGAVLALTIGPGGTTGLLIQTVSWGVCFHLLAGIWAGYLLLADRTESDFRPPPAQLVVRSDEASVKQRLRDLGATDVRPAEDAIY